CRRVADGLERFLGQAALQGGVEIEAQVHIERDVLSVARLERRLRAYDYVRFRTRQSHEASGNVNNGRAGGYSENAALRAAFLIRIPVAAGINAGSPGAAGAFSDSATGPSSGVFISKHSTGKFNNGFLTAIAHARTNVLASCAEQSVFHAVVAQK